MTSTQVLTPRTSFYVVGGTLQRDAASYVERRSDTDLHDSLKQSKFCYVLTSRQMGKSSLMVRTATRLRKEGVAVAVIDLTAIGQNLTPEQWYGGLLIQIGQELHLEDELEVFWSEHERVGPLQRWMLTIREVVLERRLGRVVIFVDEIDTVRNLPFSTDEFFAGIREFYNRRTEDPELARLTFCLLGVATPSDLMRNIRTTPFNIGRRIDLTDFTETEAAPLEKGLQREEKQEKALLKRILYWTGGHPYLTQRLCQAVAEDQTITGVAGVDRACESLFLSPRARESDNNLLFVREQILRSRADLPGLLDLYARVRSHKRVRDDDTNPLVDILRLSGITRSVRGYLSVRNQIYYRVFDRSWVAANMPDAELRRQRVAYRRGLLRATAVAMAVLLAVISLAIAAIRSRQQAIGQTRIAEKERAHAQEQARRAEEALEEARAAKQKAEEERERAERQRQMAIQQQRIAEQQRRRAESQELINLRLVYVAQMNLAQQLWEKAEVGRMLKLLTAQPENLRGFEWYYLWRLCHNDMFTFQHTSEVYSVAFSPDGRSLATGGVDGNVRLWDVATRQGRLLPSGHGGVVWSLAFSPDGKRFAAGSADGSIRLWETTTGKESPPAYNAKSAVKSIAFSPDGGLIAAGSADGKVRLWKVTTGKQLPPFEGHAKAISSVAFSPDSRRLFSTSEEGTARLWDVATMQELSLPIQENLSGITAVAVDGKRLAIGNVDGSVRMWDIITGNELAAPKKHTGAVRFAVFSPDGNTLATAGDDTAVKLWDVAAQQELIPLKGHTGPVLSVAFSPDGRSLVTGSQDKTAKLWHLDTEREYSILKEHTNGVDSLAFSPDGNRIATASNDGTVRLWDVATGKAYLLPGEGYAFTLLMFSPDGKQLIAKSEEGTVKRWDLITKRELSVPSVAEGQQVAFSPDSKWIAAGSDDGAIKLWGISTGQESLLFVGDGEAISSIAFSPDGKWLATGNEANTANLWDLTRRKERVNLKEHRGPIRSVVFSPDSRLLVTISDDRTAKMWDVATGREWFSIKGHKTSDEDTGRIISVAFSPDSRRLAALSEVISNSGRVDDKAVKLWDVGGGRELLSLETKQVTSKSSSVMAFTPDGKRLVTGGDDGNVRLWDVATGQESATLKAHGSAVLFVIFSPDGKTLATASAEKSVKLWHAASDNHVLASKR